MEPNLAHAPGNAVGQAVLDQLARTKGWTRFFSVLLWIGAIFLVLAGIAMFGIGLMGGAMGSSASTAASGLESFGPAVGGALGGLVMGAVYLVMSILYIYPALKLGGYSSRINQLLATPNEANLAAALNEQRAFWKYVGVLTLIMMAIYVVVIVIAIIAGVAGAASMGLPQG